MNFYCLRNDTKKVIYMSSSHYGMKKKKKFLKVKNLPKCRHFGTNMMNEVPTLRYTVCQKDNIKEEKKNKRGKSENS